MNRDVSQKYEAQKEYCRKNKLPLLVSPGGWCSRCGMNVLTGNGGYSLEYCETRLITACPHCRGSFCD